MPKPTNLQWRTARGTSNDVPGGVSANAGGDIELFTASGTLKCGDIVYISGDNTVATAAVAANYAKFAGVVVGGESTQFHVPNDSDLNSATQVTAALNGKGVLVQFNGIARVISDAAITAGAAVTGGTGTAGRVSTTGATAGQIVGTALAAVGGAAATLRILIAPR